MNNLSATEASRKASDKLRVMRRQMQVTGNHKTALEYQNAKLEAENQVHNLRGKIALVSG